MNLFETKVLSFINKGELLPVSSTIVVGVSGGVDSLALLYLLNRYAAEKSWQLVVAHVDHMFRGETSVQDAIFVQKQCEILGVQFAGTRIDLPSLIAETKGNGQHLAREKRYQFYEEVMVAFQAKQLVLGHHLDDQAETMLMHLVRGPAGLHNLGIRARRPFAGGALVRPFLVVSKEEIRDYAGKLGLMPREDESNAKDTYTRNRFRHKILPLLKEENDCFLAHLAQFQERGAEDDDYLQILASEAFLKIKITELNDGVSMDTTEFLLLPKPLQRRVIPLLLNYLVGRKPFHFSNKHIDGIITLLENKKPSATLYITDSCFAVKSFNQMFFLFDKPNQIAYAKEVEIPGVTVLPNRTAIEAVFSHVQEVGAPMLDQVMVPKAFLPLFVRNKQDGDKIAQLNLHGRKKVKKLFLEDKVAVHDRESWPVVLTKQNGYEEIIWVPGLAVAPLGEADTTPGEQLQLRFLTTFKGESRDDNSQ